MRVVGRATGVLTAWLIAAPVVAQPLSMLDVPERRAPTEEALAGLAELEAEEARLRAGLASYRASLDALLLRRVRARRRAVLVRYAPRIAAERRRADETRDEAIRRLEEFIARHPDSPAHTPDALLRLADLTLSRAMERDPVDAGALAPTIAAARRVLAQFPRYRMRDRASYVLGWALAEAGDADAAHEVYRAALCGPGARVSYDECRAAADSPLEIEMWLRVGEHHLDRDELAAAIAAYQRVVARPDHPLYALALYPLAWSRARAGDAAGALAGFIALIEHSDGAAGNSGTLREEALEYVAILLAREDWDGDGTPDHRQGGPHPLERLEDHALWPHDRAYANDVYGRVGRILDEQGHADEAIMAWRLRLARDPGGCDRADVVLALARTYRRLGDAAAATRTLAALSPPDASCAGGDERFRRAQEALLESALSHHARAMQ